MNEELLKESKIVTSQMTQIDLNNYHSPQALLRTRRADQDQFTSEPSRYQ